MSSIFMGQSSNEKPTKTHSSATYSKHGKTSTRSVEKHSSGAQRIQCQGQQVTLNQTQQISSTLHSQPSATKQSIASQYSMSSQITKSNKKSLMHKAVATQQKQLLQNMNYSDQQTLLNQLKNVTVANTGQQERNGRIATTTTAKSSGTGTGQRHPNAGANMFEFMSVQTVAGTNKSASQSLGSKYPPGRVSQSTRHGGKNIERVNFSSTNQTSQPVSSKLNSQQQSQRMAKKQQLQPQYDYVQEHNNNGGASTNSRLLQYEPSNNRISLGTENESINYQGQSSQHDQPGSIQTLNQGQNYAIKTGKRSVKSSERNSKIGTANLKLSTSGVSGKPDFANLIRQPASTKNNVKKLDGQQVITGVSKKMIAESLAKSVLPSKVASTTNAGTISTKSGKTSAVTQGGSYIINDSSMIMQAVSSHIQTPNNQAAKTNGYVKTNSQIQNSSSVPGKMPSQHASTALHKRKVSTQSSHQQPVGVQRVSDGNFIVNELKRQQDLSKGVQSKLTQQLQQRGGGSQRGVAQNSNKNSAIKENNPRKVPVTTRTGKSSQNSNTIGQHAFIKLKLADTQNQQYRQQLASHDGSLGQTMLESYSIQPSQPASTTNQSKVKKIANGAISQSLVGKPSKSQDRHSNNHTVNTGQKSVTNKYAKVLAGIDDFDSHPPQIHVPAGISSATNKIKKSFNFDTGGLFPQQEMSSIDNQSSGAQETSAVSRTKRQELMNQVMQNQQLAGGIPSGSFMSNPPVGMKYLTTGGTNSGQTSTQLRQSQKQAKVQNMKTQQLLLLQQQYAQASSQAQSNHTGQTSTTQATTKQTSLGLKHGIQVVNQNSSSQTSRKVLFQQPAKYAPQNQGVAHLSFMSGKSGNSTVNQGSINVKKQGQSQHGHINNNKVTKSVVSSSKPPAHAQYFNSAKIKNDGSHQIDEGTQNLASDQSVQQNRTAITTGNGKTQIEIQGNQMLCLWNVNIGQGAQANYIDQKGQFNMPYQVFQNSTNMMGQQVPTHNYQQPQNNFYPEQQHQQNQQQPNNFYPSHKQQQQMEESSSKESISHQQRQQKLSSNSKGRNGSRPQGSAKINSNQRQVEINQSAKSGTESNSIATVEAGIFNKHFKRKVQTKVPLNIRTKKQMSTEAIMQQAGLNQGQNTTTQSVKNNSHSMVSQAKHIVLQKSAVEPGEGSQSQQQKLVKLLANTAMHKQQSQKQKSSGPQEIMGKPKAQNSSSMEQRRGSNSRQPTTRGNSSKKQNPNQAAMMLLTDNREMAEIAQQHMPRVNLSTTHKTTNDQNLNFLDMQQQHKQMLGNTQQNSQLKKVGMLVNNYFDQQEHCELLTEQIHQQKQPLQHKRMQSLVTDPQFITQLGLASDDSGGKQMQANQQFRGHTTKNTSSKPTNLFIKDPSPAVLKTNTGRFVDTMSQPSHKQQQQRNSNITYKQPSKKAANASSQMNKLESNNNAVLAAHQQSPYIINSGGQTAPKAKKPPVAFNEEDLLGSSEFDMENEELMRRIEAEWQQNDINQHSNFNSEKGLMATEQLPKGFGVTQKGPLLSLQTANPMADQKLKTQDVGEILRKAKHDFISRESGAEPYEDDCVVEETDPEELSYPKHEPTQVSSLHKNKASNMSQHTSSTGLAHKNQKSPKNVPEGTENLLQGAYLREQQANMPRHQNADLAESQQPVPDAEFPMPVRTALKLYAKTGKLTDYEKTELLDFKKVYFLGLEANKIQGKASGRLHNSGYDDENGDYNVILKDHLYYRFEVLDFVGKGSFGQALKCLDHKTGEIVAVKIIKNKERYQHQAGVELHILQHLQKHDTEDQNNIIQIKDHCIFRSHLIISFELFSINLYEFIKNNNFQGVSLSLIRRFAIQILQSLKFLKDEDVIHCDLKPENILLKSPDKSGIKIIDFGSSCFSNQRIYSYIQSRFYRAPEIIIGIPYTTGIDMWSFGCILIELYTGIPIFPGESETEQLALIMQTFGLPPLKILENAERKDKFFQPGSNEPLNMFEEQDGSLRLPGSRPLIEVIGDQSETFFDFICQCLAWDPEERISPLDALQHPWILEGLPKRVLIHHQRMLGLDVPSESSQASLYPDQVDRHQVQPPMGDLSRVDTDGQECANLVQFGHSVPTDPSRDLLNMNDGDDYNQMNYQGSYAGLQDISQSNPFELGTDEDYLDDDANLEVLNVHNRSTQQHQDLQLPPRQIDNGMANQFRVESIQNKQKKNKNEQAATKPAKQEMSRTQPMPSHFLQGVKKQSKHAQQQNIMHLQDPDDEADLNYQSHENGQQMLKFQEMQQFNRQNGQNASDNDQMADFVGVDDLVGQDELQEVEQLNPKSKTVNMSSLLKQINKSIKKAGKQSKYEIETGGEIGANPMLQMPPSTTAGTTRYKLPQSNGLLQGSVRGAPGLLPDTYGDFQAGFYPQQPGQEQNVSFLMKHRIRQAAGEQPHGVESSVQQMAATTTARTTAAANAGNHGNNKNVNKIALNTQKEPELMSDYALVGQPSKGYQHQQASKLTSGSARVSTHAGPAKQSRHQNRA